MQNYIDELYKKIWITRGCRFIAHSRFKTLSNFSLLTVGLLSSYVIGVSLLLFDPQIVSNKATENFLTILIIFISLVILVVSIIESSKEYKLRGENLHRCGMELGFIYEELIKMKSDLYKEDLEGRIDKISKEYNSIINKYSENHSNLDYLLFQARNFKDFKITKCKSVVIEIWIWLNVRIIFLIFVFLPIILFLIIYEKFI